jgi:polyisoprenoid-binding protein YceI
MKRFVTLLICLCSISIIHAQQYQPVDDKSTVKFAIKNFGISTGGSFKGMEGAIEFDKANPEKTVFDISISSTTVNTDNSARDSHLRKEEYFDVVQFPKISFKSEKVSTKGSNYTVSGQLTIKGITKTIAFPFKATVTGEGYLFEGSFQLNRRDYKVGGNSFVLGDNVTVSLSVFAKKK